jgi:hypothetical protein
MSLFTDILQVAKGLKMALGSDSCTHLAIKNEETGSAYLLGLIKNRVVRRDLWRRISIGQLLCAKNIKRVTNGQRVTSSRSGLSKGET